MVDQLSPLQPVLKPGSHGNFTRGTGVTLGETAPGSIVQVAGWPGQEKALVVAISKITGLSFVDGPGAGIAIDGKAVFGIAPRRFLVVDDSEDLASRLIAGISEKVGTVTDLSHGRTALRVSGPKAEWVLAKIFALDFSSSAFPEGAGRSTTHHDIFTQIQRTGPSQFDLYVFRSFARSFWSVLCHAAEEVGYEVR
jgi:heterotetrameric sarcosine oxidase gamma subunit